MPPLPELSLATEWFWTSGADGVLRIQGCGDCGHLVHPPTPICPSCRSRSVKPTEVSGRATVIGFTVNEHRWLPDFDPPYVVANVALADDPSVHLTTNIVGCEPNDVRIGQEVAVRFEQREDVWVPLFEPTGGVDPSIGCRPLERRTPRPPVSAERFEHRAVLSGVGRSKLGRRLMVDPLALAVDACLEAVADAGLTLDDIDGLSTYPGGLSGGGMSEGGPTEIEEALRIHPTWHNGGLDLPGPGGSVIAAAMAVATGLCRARPLFPDGLGLHPRGADGRGKVPPRGRAGHRLHDGMARTVRRHVGRQLDRHARQPVHAPLRRSREMFGHIAINARTNAGRNPAAIYRDPMTMDDYMSARPITSPSASTTATCPATGRSR